jgi:hypothetical protein
MPRATAPKIPTRVLRLLRLGGARWLPVPGTPCLSAYSTPREARIYPCTGGGGYNRSRIDLSSRGVPHASR